MEKHLWKLEIPKQFPGLGKIPGTIRVVTKDKSVVQITECIENLDEFDSEDIVNVEYLGIVFE